MCAYILRIIKIYFSSQADVAEDQTEKDEAV